MAGAGGGGAAGSGGSSALPMVGGAGNVAVTPPTPAGAPSVEPEPEPEPHAAVPCENPMPYEYGGGFITCDDHGSLRRPAPAACESSLPRPDPVDPAFVQHCSYDADCVEKNHGHCEFGECEYGCVVDAECASNEICFCGEAIGFCLVALCKSDKDCPADYPCSANKRFGFDYAETFCQSPYDACITDHDCNSLDPAVSCDFGELGRECVRRYVG